MYLIFILTLDYLKSEKDRLQSLDTFCMLQKIAHTNIDIFFMGSQYPFCMKISLILKTFFRTTEM